MLLSLHSYLISLNNLRTYMYSVAKTINSLMHLRHSSIPTFPTQVCTFFHFFCAPYDDTYADEDDFDPTLYGTVPQTCFTGKLIPD